MRHVAFIIVIMATLTMTGSVDAKEPVSDRERFELWNGCQPLELEVFGIQEYDMRKGWWNESLNERVETTVRSRLRAARIYTADPSASHLVVHVDIFKMSFNITFTHMKWVEDELSGVEALGVVWEDGSYGQHGLSPDYLVSVVSEITDHFVDEFLRVNESAC